MNIGQNEKTKSYHRKKDDNCKNIYFIAREAGVSVATISRFFNDNSLVKKSTSLKILEICKKYNYKPSKVASAITTKKTKSVAFLVPTLKDPSFNGLISGVESVLTSKGYCMILFSTTESINIELEILNNIRNRIIDGVIVSGVYGSDEDKLFISEIQKRGIPYLLVDRYIPEIDIPYVASNDYYGGEIAANYILENNHKNIGIITYDTKVHIFKERISGFTSVLKKEGIKEKYIIEIPRQIGKIEESIIKNKDIFLNNKVTVIFAIADMIAIHLIHFLSENNFKIPEEISIMGYDNMFFSKFTTPELTTIDHDMFELGAVAARNLINKLEKNKYKEKKIIIDPKLLVRDSVKKI